MSNLSFDSTPSNRSSSTEFEKIDWFKLAKDGDTALVRFMYDTREELEADCKGVHDIVVNGIHRNINCLGSDCPLCKYDDPKAFKYKQVVVLRMLVYTMDRSTGKVIATPSVWTRPYPVAKYDILPALETYGSLKNNLCKVIRSGNSFNDTRYTFMWNLQLTKNLDGSPKYPDELFTKETTAFDKYKPVGHAIMNKTAAEITAWLQTGSFPEKATQSQYEAPKAPAAPAPEHIAPSYPPAKTAPIKPAYGKDDFLDMSSVPSQEEELPFSLDDFNPVKTNTNTSSVTPPAGFENLW